MATPPFPTNDLTASSDQPPINTYSPASDMADMLNWTNQFLPDITATIGKVWDELKLPAKALALLEEVAGWLILSLLKFVLEFQDAWLGAVTKVYSGILPTAEQYQAQIGADALGLLQLAINGTPSQQVDFGASPMASVAAQLFESVVRPFTLVHGTADPRQVGSGLANQSYLLGQAMNLQLQEWVIDSTANHIGMGILHILQPFLGIIDRTINPQNVVRQAMDASFALLLRAPLTRDLNRQFPIKDLGVQATAKLFIRGAITQQQYLDKCLDAGLDSTQAQQLLLESATLLPRGDVAKLLNMGYLSSDDARKLLAQSGFQPDTIDAVLYLDTHDRYFKLQETIGNEAIAAWKKKYIDQSTLESLLQQLGFTQDEITLIEIEAQFAKPIPQKKLTYSQVRDSFTENLMGIDEVIQYLEEDGYSPDDVQKLILLDFTKAEERKLRSAELIARYRVAAEAARVSAAEEALKGEQQLSAAKTDLAKQLDQAASDLGALQSTAGILSLIGTPLP